MTSGASEATRVGVHGEAGEGGPLVGAEVRRREDDRLVRGRGTYTDNVTPPDTLYVAVHRSQCANGRIVDIDVERASAHDDVVAVYTWPDVRDSDYHGVIQIPSQRLDVDVPGHPILARERVRYHGQPIAAVVATDRYVAHAAAEAIEVDYDRYETVTDPARATEDDAPALYDTAPDNIVATATVGDREATDAAFESAPHTVEVRLRNNRLIPFPIEPRAALAEYDDVRDRLRVTLTSQSPHGHRASLSKTLGVPERKLQVRVPDVGGGFGEKGKHYPGDAIASWCALELERPVKWVATRSENCLAGIHGRDHVSHAELAYDESGTVLGVRVDTYGGIGGYSLEGGALRPSSHIGLVNGQYRIPAAHYTANSVFTNAAPIHAYRGAGRPEAVYVIERLLDLAARDLGVDPATIRAQNQVRTDQFPYETATELVYDSGDYEATMETALEAVDYEALRERQAALRAEGRLLGIGIGNYVETTGKGYQSGVVRVNPSGDVTVLTSALSYGQGHETTYAQIVSDALGVSYDDIDVVQGDTDQIPTGKGTSGSRSTVLAGNAVAESAQAVREKAERIAAHHLEVDRADIDYADGTFHVRGAPEQSFGFGSVAAEAYGGDIPAGMDPGLEATTFYDAEGTAFSFGTHVAVVEVDPETGAVTLDRYLAVDDCGEQINPMIVDGQVHGGVVQGIGQARSEHAVYDDAGNLVAGTLMDYGVPKSIDLPDLETEATITPSPLNPLGVKGIGEGGTIAAPPTIVNAVVDALEPHGVDHLDMPVTDETVWQALQSASS